MRGNTSYGDTSYGDTSCGDMSYGDTSYGAARPGYGDTGYGEASYVGGEPTGRHRGSHRARPARSRRYVAWTAGFGTVAVAVALVLTRAGVPSSLYANSKAAGTGPVALALAKVTPSASPRAATSRTPRIASPAPSTAPAHAPVRPASPAPAATPPSVSVPVTRVTAPAPAILSGYAEQVVTLTNAERAKVGCPALTVDPRLIVAALAHSEDMALHNYFDHNSQDGTTPFQRITAAGYSFSVAAENIAAGQATPADVMTAWMNSAGHKANILNCSLKQIGVGYATGGTYGTYWTQDFGTP